MTNYSSARRDWKLKAFKVAHAFMLMRNSDMICMRKRRVWGLIAAPAIFCQHIFLLSALFRRGGGDFICEQRTKYSVSTLTAGVLPGGVCVLCLCSRPPEARSCTRSGQSGQCVRFCHVAAEETVAPQPLCLCPDSAAASRSSKTPLCPARSDI